nr:hypothetical protein [Gammaproteobacteria bacterium]
PSIPISDAMCLREARKDCSYGHLGRRCPCDRTKNFYIEQCVAPVLWVLLSPLFGQGPRFVRISL